MKKNKLEFVSLASVPSIMHADPTVCSGCNNNDHCNYKDDQLDATFLADAPAFLFADFLPDRYFVPNSEQKKNISIIASKLMQPIHDHFKAPVIIHSGLRAESKNYYGNLNSSLHHKGLAVDFIVKGISIYKVVEFISKNLDFNELAVCDIGKERPYLHISYLESGNKKSLIARDKGEETFVSAKLKS